jgi:hypothetical protein
MGETKPEGHCDTFTTMVPLSMAERMTLVRLPSTPPGAFPIPNDAKMRPRRLGTRRTESTISALTPGKIQRQATCAVSRHVVIWNSAILFGRRTRDQLTSMPSPLTLARGSQLGLWKASKEAAEILVVLLPRYSLW